MLRAGRRCRNSGDGAAYLSGAAAAPVRQRRQGWEVTGGGGPGGRNSDPNDQPEDPDGKDEPPQDLLKQNEAWESDKIPPVIHF